MLNRMFISMPQRNASNNIVYKDEYIKPKMPTMRMTMFSNDENNNRIKNIEQGVIRSFDDSSEMPEINVWEIPTMRMTMFSNGENNNRIKNVEPVAIRSFYNAPSITEISMREILGTPKKNCSSCRGG